MERLKLLSFLCLFLPVLAVISDGYSWYHENEGFWKPEAQTTGFMISSLEQIWARHGPGSPEQFKQGVSGTSMESYVDHLLMAPAPLVLVVPSIIFFVFYRITTRSDRRKAGAFDYKRD